jgi:hypothetical protein
LGRELTAHGFSFKLSVGGFGLKLSVGGFGLKLSACSFSLGRELSLGFTKLSPFSVEFSGTYQCLMSF